MFRHLRYYEHTTEDPDHRPEGDHKIPQGFRGESLPVPEEPRDRLGQMAPWWRRQIWVEKGIDVHM